MTLPGAAHGPLRLLEPVPQLPPLQPPQTPPPGLVCTPLSSVELWAQGCPCLHPGATLTSMGLLELSLKQKQVPPNPKQGPRSNTKSRCRDSQAGAEWLNSVLCGSPGSKWHLVKGPHPGWGGLPSTCRTSRTRLPWGLRSPMFYSSSLWQMWDHLCQRNTERRIKTWKKTPGLAVALGRSGEGNQLSKGAARGSGFYDRDGPQSTDGSYL